MKITVILIYFFYAVFAYSQSDSSLVQCEEKINYLDSIFLVLKTENSRIKAELKKCNSEIQNLNTKLKKSAELTDSINNQMHLNALMMNKIAEKLDLKITDIETGTRSSINRIDESLRDNFLYGIIGILSAILISILLYWLLKKKQEHDKKVIEEKIVSELTRQTESMVTQFQALMQKTANARTSQSSEHDHSLALKFAGEINTIERNISLMDKETRGIKQLMRSVETLKDNLMANGYEMPELLGKELPVGLKVIIINSATDDNIKKGSQLITKVLIPQVNYNGKMIQAAQIDVTTGN